MSARGHHTGSSGPLGGSKHPLKRPSQHKTKKCQKKSTTTTSTSQIHTISSPLTTPSSLATRNTHQSLQSQQQTPNTISNRPLSTSSRPQSTTIINRNNRHHQQHQSNPPTTTQKRHILGSTDYSDKNIKTYTDFIKGGLNNDHFTERHQLPQPLAHEQTPNLNPLDPKYQKYMPDDQVNQPDVVRLSTKDDFNLDFDLELQWQRVNQR